VQKKCKGAERNRPYYNGEYKMEGDWKLGLLEKQGPIILRGSW